jgi:hypothetical protein
MIHRIKALYDEGRGLSIRAISRELAHICQPGKNGAVKQ